MNNIIDVNPVARIKERLFPRISVITPSYNQGQFIGQTIKSIISQCYPNLEYIIVDGKSTDNTIDVIKKYESEISYWVSEKDGGQSEAINKGFSKATGEIVAWINSDDEYCENALSTVADIYRKSKFDVLFGPWHNYFVESKTKGRVYQPEGIEKYNFLMFWNSNHRWHQPSLFFSRKFIEEGIVVDEKLNLSMDYDLVLKLMLRDYVIAIHEGEPLSISKIHSMAKTVKNFNGIFLELLDVTGRYAKYFSSSTIEEYRKGRIKFLFSRAKLLFLTGQPLWALKYMKKIYNCIRMDGL